MSKTINHADLVEAVAAKTEEAQTTVKSVLAALAEVATENLKKDVIVTLHGLGKLKPIKRNARIGRNPKTREPVEIAASRSVKFTLTKDLKEALN
ncbi:HU family DNA-binding protein [Entomomonas sp. E2T0]|uniref:HU family DNA-binding protein n=1 Tax=Entomomonas sp. E2T0 TaxID=2930213 RepID=UPI0022280F69|nr:HU family DNA-binding protein [Entomomonas sp. E2T0]UYZ84315.1 HU family DNA-binding protein [Entomomonas sp. E2T0]